MSSQTTSKMKVAHLCFKLEILKLWNVEQTCMYVLVCLLSEMEGSLGKYGFVYATMRLVLTQVS